MEHAHAKLLEAFAKNTSLVVQRNMGKGVWGLSQWKTVAADEGGRYQFRIKGEGTEDRINWEHVSPKYNYMARDSNGDVGFYEKQPVICGGEWLLGGGHKVVTVFAEGDVPFSTYSAGTVAWDHSLSSRYWV